MNGESWMERLESLLATNPVELFEVVMSQPWYLEMLRGWVIDGGLSNGQILEVGCGPGLLTVELKNDANTVTALDKSSDMIAAAKKRALARAVDISFVCGDAAECDLGDDRFDCVLGSSIVNVVSDPDALVRVMVRLAKAGGKLSLLFPNPTFTLQRAQQLSEELQLEGASEAVMQIWARRAKKMEPDEVCSVLGRAGATDIRTTSLLHGVVSAVTGMKQVPRGVPMA